jgi:hypothetical protein
MEIRWLKKLLIAIVRTRDIFSARGPSGISGSAEFGADGQSMRELRLRISRK